MSFVSSTRTCNNPIEWDKSHQQRIHGEGYGRYEYPPEEEPEKSIPPHMVRSRQKEFEADFQGRRSKVEGANGYSGGMRMPPKGPNNQEGRKDLFGIMKQQRPKDGEVPNPDSWIGRVGNNPQGGKAMCANSPKLSADRVNDCLKDISYIKKHGDPNRPKYYDGEWVGNPAHRTQPMEPIDSSAGGYKYTQHKSNAESRKDFFARMYGDPDHRSSGMDGWLGNRKIDPSKGLYRPDRAEDELGPGLIKKNDTPDAGAPGYLKPIKDQTEEFKECFQPELHHPARATSPMSRAVRPDEIKPAVNRGPRKVPEPVGRSQRKGMWGIMSHGTRPDGAVGDDYLPTGRHGVKVPGSDTQVGKGSLLLYTNEYCSGMGRRGIDDLEDDL